MVLTDYNNYTPDASKTFSTPNTLHIHVYASHASDKTHRKSVTGIAAFLTGGCILYKTKFQDAIALSSTEAEFIAAYDARKDSLYICPILRDINIEHHLSVVK